MYRIVASAFLIILGCGPQEVATVSVRGSVTLDGKPLSEGQIFFSTLGQVPTALQIRDGVFEGKVSPGVKRVEIGVYRPATIPKGQAGPPPPQGMLQNTLPARYHAQSTLTATIGDTPKDLKFSLTSNP